MNKKAESLEQTGKPDIRDLYRQMLRSRIFETEVTKLWKEGLISGEMHLGIGEEAIAAGIVAQLREGDAMALDHRGTPPLLMRGVDPVLVLREFLGRSDGLCSGMGGHMHLFSREYLSASSGIVGSTGPTAVGFALAARHLRPETLAVAFFGEGAANQGMLMEAMNLSVAWKLPVVFVCKNNRMAITTPSTSTTGANLAERAEGFGMPAVEVDGKDVEEVWHEAYVAATRARKGEGPSFILAHCSHPEGHMLGDPLLRIARNPLREIKPTIWPLVKSFINPRGASIGKRTESMGTITSLIKDTIKGQFSKQDDPLKYSRKKLAYDKKWLKELEREVKLEMQKAVESALEPGNTEE